MRTKKGGRSGGGSLIFWVKYAKRYRSTHGGVVNKGRKAGELKKRKEGGRFSARGLTSDGGAGVLQSPRLKKTG